MLEDTNGDGKVDQRTVFAENVLEVSGLMAVERRLIVTSAPESCSSRTPTATARPTCARCFTPASPR